MTILCRKDKCQQKGESGVVKKGLCLFGDDSFEPQTQKLDFPCVEYLANRNQHTMEMI